MGRIHSTRKGKSGSHKPFVKENPEWVPIAKAEVEELIVKLKRDGNSAAKIGLVLRDQYGVPSVKLATGRSVAAILKEKGLTPRLPDDLVALMRKAVYVNEHVSGNPKDHSTKRGLQLIEARIRRLEKYYASRKLLPEGWRYSLDRAKLELE